MLPQTVLVHAFVLVQHRCGYCCHAALTEGGAVRGQQILALDVRQLPPSDCRVALEVRVIVVDLLLLLVVAVAVAVPVVVIFRVRVVVRVGVAAVHGVGVSPLSVGAAGGFLGLAIVVARSWILLPQLSLLEAVLVLQPIARKLLGLLLGLPLLLHLVVLLLPLARRAGDVATAPSITN